MARLHLLASAAIATVVGFALIAELCSEEVFGFCAFVNGDLTSFQFNDETPQSDAIALLDVGTFGATATIQMVCFATDTAAVITNPVIAAVKVGAVH